MRKSHFLLAISIVTAQILDILFWEWNKIHMLTIAKKKKKIKKIKIKVVTDRYFAISIISLNQFRAAATPSAQGRMYFSASLFS